MAERNIITYTFPMCKNGLKLEAHCHLRRFISPQVKGSGEVPQKAIFRANTVAFQIEIIHSQFGMEA